MPGMDSNPARGAGPTGRRARNVSIALLATAALAGTVFAPAADSQDAGADEESDTRVVLVTGSTGGLGREVALRLAASGTHVIIHGRDTIRGREVVEEVERAGGSARFYAADFASLDEVRRLASEVRRDHQHLDALVNNAGIWLTRGDRRLSEDGHELHFQVNYLAGYLLTRELLPLLERGAPSRIVNVASAAQTPIDFDDPMMDEGYSGGRAYGQSKLAQILYTIDLAERLAGSGITVAALHPATLMETDMVREAGIPPRATVAEGAEAVIALLDGDAVESGAYFDGMRRATPNDQALRPEARERLRTLSEELVGR